MAKEYSMPTTTEGKALLRKLLSEKFNMGRLAEVAEEVGAEIGSAGLSPYDFAGAIIRGTPTQSVPQLIAIVLGEGPIQARAAPHLRSDEKRLKAFCQANKPEDEKHADESGADSKASPSHQSVSTTEQSASRAEPSSSTKRLDDLIALWKKHIKGLSFAGNQLTKQERLTDITQLQLKGKTLIHKHANWLTADWDALSRKSTNANFAMMGIIYEDVPAAQLRQELLKKLPLLEHAREELSNEPQIQAQSSTAAKDKSTTRSSSGARKNKQEKASSSDVVIICALPSPELEKVKKAGDRGKHWKEIQAHPKDPHTYHKTVYTTEKGTNLDIIACAPTQMGLSASAILATKAILTFNPKLVAMIGIAAGADVEKQGYGNILAADTTFDYGAGKNSQKKNGEIEFQADPAPLPIDTRLKSLLKAWESQDAKLASIRNDWPASPPQTALRLHVGPLGSGAAVIDNENQIPNIKSHWRKLIGIEMEAYGVHRACQDTVEPPPKFLCLKSICDFANQKTDGWQHYAAYTAAEFCYLFLTQEWENLFPGEARDEDEG